MFAIGFSTNTSRPAANAASACARCRPFGRHEHDRVEVVGLEEGLERRRDWAPKLLRRRLRVLEVEVEHRSDLEVAHSLDGVPDAAPVPTQPDQADTDCVCRLSWKPPDKVVVDARRAVSVALCQVNLAS